MFRKLVFLVIGLCLLAVAAMWFLNPSFSDQVMALFYPESQVNTRSFTSPQASQVFETLKLVLDGANAVFGAIGIYLATKGLLPVRGQSQSQQQK